MKPTPKKIELQTVEHFDNDGNSLGFLNELESLELRCQIAEQAVDGYYAMYKGEKIEITKSGKYLEFDASFYTEQMYLLSRLFKAQRNGN